MDFVGGSDGSREVSSKGSWSSSSPSHRRLLQLGGWGGNCSISPQIYDDHQRRERDRDRDRAVDFDFRRSNHEDQVVTGEMGESDRDRVVTEEEREHMFDKVVTPSDVGKLNRLVIPKQHAERYFPLDSTNNDKGLLLNFEDRSGKSWWFRYSYWNSSQSYVMTKGWSRFVKDKKLDAGDVVSFHRSSSSRDRLFIDWRRRPSSAAAPPNHHFSWSPLLMRPPPPLQPTLPHYYSQHHHHHNYNHHQYHNNYPMSNYHPYRYGYGSVVAGSERPKYPYSNAMISHEDEEQSLIRNLQPPEERAAGGKKLMRLFGVNMECSSGTGGDDEVDDGDVSATPQQHHLQLRLYNGNDNKGKAISISNSNPNPMSLDLDLDLDLDM